MHAAPDVAARDASDAADRVDAVHVADVADVADVVPGCGNGVVEPGEECDDGPANGNAPDACRADCRRARCGDAVTDTGEACDDGNAQEGDACDSNCTLPGCGNTIRDPGELCFAPMDFATAAGPGAIAVGDYDHDGALDLAVAARSANVVSVLPGNGRGAFGAPQNVSTTASPVALAAADANHDGVLDLLVAESTGPTGQGRLEYFAGAAHGAFALAGTYSAGIDTTSIAAGDLNTDGFADAVLTNQNSNSISVFMGSATGFGAGATIRQGNAAGVAIGDMNGDHRHDLTVVAYDDPVLVYPGNGAGGFGAPTYSGAGPNPDAVDLGDLDHDGDLDAVVANAGTTMQAVLRNDGAGNLTPSNFDLGVTGRNVAVADVDADGWVDVVLPRFDANDVALLRNDRAGGLRPQITYPTAAHPLDVRVGDFNADGLPDMAVACYGGAVVRVLLSNP